MFCFSSDWFFKLMYFLSRKQLVRMSVCCKNKAGNVIIHCSEVGSRGKKHQLLISVPLCWSHPWLLSAMPITNTFHYSKKIYSVTQLYLFLPPSRHRIFLALKDLWMEILVKKKTNKMQSTSGIQKSLLFLFCFVLLSPNLICQYIQIHFRSTS